MSWFYRHCLRPLLFSQPSEPIHDRTLKALGVAANSQILSRLIGQVCKAPVLPIERFGLAFPNPVGLAAGMDKQAAALPVWERLGFGFCELGGVTWHPQPGNPAPRMFRAVADRALINRMGFNNPGAEAMAGRLRHWRAVGRWPRHPVGINLGKSKVTPLAGAADDYAQSFRALRSLADFFVVNVSSPNTPNLRQLQDKSALDDILRALQEINGQAGGGEARPILVKVAPDLSWDALDEILELTGPRNVAGIVATNTTLARPEATDAALRAIYQETGGLSGRPLRERSTAVVRHLYRQSRGRLPIIGVGGIFTGGDAWEKITAGACLVQVYTGPVYEGPILARQVVRTLKQKLTERGLGSIAQAVGIEN